MRELLRVNAELKAMLAITHGHFADEAKRRHESEMMRLDRERDGGSTTS